MRRLLAPLFLSLLPVVCQAEDVIRVLNWNDYIAPQVLKDFEKETGIRVEYRTFSTAEELKQALDNNEEIDIAVPSNDTLPELIKAGKLQPLDLSQLPNRTHLDPQLMSKLAAFDPKNRYAVPYLWGAVGLAVNTPQAEAAYGGPLPASWSVLFDPQQSSKLASCGISVLDAPEETLSILMNYQGRVLSDSSPRQIKRAGNALQALRPNLRYVDSERYIEDLAHGKLCVSLAWVGDALAAADAGQPVTFSIPQEGSILFIDNLVIPTNARRADLAHRFINYLMKPEVAALITEETLYPNGNQDSLPFIDEKLRNQPGITFDRTTKRRLALLDPLPARLVGPRDEVWDAFRKGS